MPWLMRIVCAFLLLAGVLTAVQIAVAADKKAPPIPPEKFVGIWSGFSRQGLSFTRLELDRDGTGYCARVPVFGKNVYAYRVTSWRVEGFELTIQMSDGQTVLHLRTPATSQLLLVLQWDEGRRSQKSFLYPETIVRVSDQATQKAIEELKLRAEPRQ